MCFWISVLTWKLGCCSWWRDRRCVLLSIETKTHSCRELCTMCFLSKVSANDSITMLENSILGVCSIYPFTNVWWHEGKRNQILFVRMQECGNLKRDKNIYVKECIYSVLIHFVGWKIYIEVSGNNSKHETYSNSS